jgi:hypothetical protein
MNHVILLLNAQRSFFYRFTENVESLEEFFTQNNATPEMSDCHSDGPSGQHRTGPDWCIAEACLISGLARPVPKTAVNWRLSEYIRHRRLIAIR